MHVNRQFLWNIKPYVRDLMSASAVFRALILKRNDSQWK